VKPEGSLSHLQEPTSHVSIQSQVNPVHASIPLLEEPFKIILPSTPGSSKWSLSQVYTQNLRERDRLETQAWYNYDSAIIVFRIKAPRGMILLPVLKADCKTFCPMSRIRPVTAMPAPQ